MSIHTYTRWYTDDESSYTRVYEKLRVCVYITFLFSFWMELHTCWLLILPQAQWRNFKTTLYLLWKRIKISVIHHLKPTRSRALIPCWITHACIIAARHTTPLEYVNSLHPFSAPPCRPTNLITILFAD